MKILPVVFVLMLSLLGCQEKKETCADCGEGGWQKLEDKCSGNITNEMDCSVCLSSYNWSGITEPEKPGMETKEEVIEFGNNKNLKVYRYKKWACDLEGNLYLESQLG